MIRATRVDSGFPVSGGTCGAGVRLERAVRSGCTGASGTAVRLLRFGLVGASGFAVDVACYLALQWIGLDHRVARFVSFFPAASWNWLLNRRVTFSERAPDARARQWARFVTSSVAGAGVNAGSYAVLTSLIGFFDQHRMLALLLGVGLGGIANFALATRYVYRRRRVADTSRIGPSATLSWSTRSLSFAGLRFFRKTSEGIEALDGSLSREGIVRIRSETVGVTISPMEVTRLIGGSFPGSASFAVHAAHAQSRRRTWRRWPVPAGGRGAVSGRERHR